MFTKLEYNEPVGAACVTENKTLEAGSPPGMSRGFSFLQILFVVTLGVLSASIAIPEYQNSLAEYRLMNESNLLASQLNVARTLSISSGSPHSVVVNPGTGLAKVIDSNDPQVAIREERLAKSVHLMMRQSTITFQTRGTATPTKILIEGESSSSDRVLLTVGSSGKTRLRRLTQNDDEYDTEYQQWLEYQQSTTGSQPNP